MSLQIIHLQNIVIKVPENSVNYNTNKTKKISYR